jgi:hypothetical protein
MLEDKPDAGLLTEAEKKKIQEWFERFGKNLACPVCKATKWMVFDRFVSPMVLGGAKRNELNLGIIQPSFVLTCANCGNNHFISALATKVFSPPPSDDGGQT